MSVPSLKPDNGDSVKVNELLKTVRDFISFFKGSHLHLCNSFHLNHSDNLSNFIQVDFLNTPTFYLHIAFKTSLTAHTKESGFYSQVP